MLSWEQMHHCASVIPVRPFFLLSIPSVGYQLDQPGGNMQLIMHSFFFRACRMSRHEEKIRPMTWSIAFPTAYNVPFTEMNCSSASSPRERTLWACVLDRLSAQTYMPCALRVQLSSFSLSLVLLSQSDTVLLAPCVCLLSYKHSWPLLNMHIFLCFLK